MSHMFFVLWDQTGCSILSMVAPVWYKAVLSLLIFLTSILFLYEKHLLKNTKSSLSTGYLAQQQSLECFLLMKDSSIHKRLQRRGPGFVNSFSFSQPQMVLNLLQRLRIHYKPIRTAWGVGIQENYRLCYSVGRSFHLFFRPQRDNIMYTWNIY